jgi:beta-galactosidase
MNVKCATGNAENWIFSSHDKQSGKGLPQPKTLARWAALLGVLQCVGIFLVLWTATGVAAGAMPEKSRTITPFDGGWQFLQGDPVGAETRDFDDSKWHEVNLPHDWSIAGPFAATNKTGGAGAFLPSGVAWYRSRFTVPTNELGRHVWIEFDGVMQNSKVWVNGVQLGERPFGYSSFRYDLTPYLKFGGDDIFNLKAFNVIAVRCDTSAQPASRWYSGAGIYRHVRLVVVDPIHVEGDGLFVSTPEVSSDKATVQVETSLANETKASRQVGVVTTVFSPEGKNVGSILSTFTATNGVSSQVRQHISIEKPELWNLESPKLYRVVVKVVLAGNLVLDETSTTLGVRDAHFEPETGFWLNGKNFKIKGVAVHHDGGAFGAAVPIGVWQDRLETLKLLGVNAIRTAHNPPAPEFLDLCDRMGFLVMDEFFDCWTVAKNPYDYHLYFNDWSHRDAADAIRRDRNHPSVIIYSVGNEIHDTPKPAIAKPILAGLVEVCHENDPTRPVTQALFRPNVSGDYTNGLADLLDVVGQNYRENEILAAHTQKPSRKILGTENTHDRNQWIAMRDHAPYAGQFLWTGIDYLGESRRWPVVGHASGLLDRTARIRPLGTERESWWLETPMVAMARRTANDDAMPTDPGYAQEERHTQVLFSDWSPKNTAAHEEQVEVYSNCKDVELFLNGESLGKKEINANASPRVWRVAFAPGTLKAVASNGGKVVASQELRTAGAPAAIQLETKNAQIGTSWDDVAIVRATIVDANGVPVPRANDLVSFSVSGPGVIAAVDNGDNESHESFQASERKAYLGQCVVFVKANGKGKIQVTAKAEGLSSKPVVVEGK